MNKNKYLLLVSSLGVLALLIVAAVDENWLRDWRVQQKSAAAASNTVDLRLRQIVIPRLGVTDRCVSCHVGMMPGETPLPGHPLLAAHSPVVHDPAQFGCTVCHGGQGRATEQDDAHGHVHFWPEPMIPLSYASAGCGTCHTHLQVPELAALHEGERLLERYDCLACHRLEGRGGTLRPGAGGGMEGPDLSLVGSRGWQRDWYENHLQRLQNDKGGVWKLSFGPLDDSHRSAIENYLASRVGAPDLVEAKALFHSLGCRGCHKIRGVGGTDGPDLSQVGLKDVHRLDFTHVRGEHTLPNWLAEHFRWPAKVVPGSKMPALGLSDEQIEQLTLYMLSLRSSEASEGFWPKDRVRAERFQEREFAAQGSTLFGTFCAACHGSRGEGRLYPESTPIPAIANPDFLSIASDEFLRATISGGRPGRRMPSWTEGGLRAEEINELIAHLRALSQTKNPPETNAMRRWVRADVALGQSRFLTLCAGCHGKQGEGSAAPALHNPALLANASDTYLVETIRQGRRGTPMPGFGRPSAVFPVLPPNEIESIVAYLRTWEEKNP